MIHSTAAATQPLVTIGISTYDRADGTFPEALRSALAQSYANLEVVVCDNASQDGTQAFMEAQRDPRLRYHRHPVNIGANANFNACLEHARGTYFLLLHDDDLLEPDFIERALTAIGRRAPGIALGGVRMIDASGTPLYEVAPPPADLEAAELFLTWFARRFSFYFCATLFHTEQLRELGGFSSPEDLFQDVVAIAQLAGRAGYVSVPGIAGSFRTHAANRGSESHALRWTRDAEYLLDVLQREYPDEASRLYAAGAPYLTHTCYRYADSVRSPLERLQLFRQIHARFGRTYTPWQYLLRSRSQRLRNLLGRQLRRLRQRGSSVTGVAHGR